MSLHYRHVALPGHDGVRALVARVLRHVPSLALIPGHEVFDFVPRVGWGKGQAARWIVRHAGRVLRPGSPVVLYAGDDTTDEAAFAALKGRALTVRVGGGESGAEYAVSGVREVHVLLRWIDRALG